MPDFARLLDEYIQHAGLPLRRLASQAGIPHQTLFNWLKGTQPRWHAALPQDLHRLGISLGLADDEITLLLRQAGCISARSEIFLLQEACMDNPFRIPKGWFVTGDAPENYAIGVDPEVRYADHGCVTLKAGPQATEFAALAQTIKAEAFRGKRLKFSAAVRAADLENMAALFMRISAADGKMLAFDNMRNRKITGSSDWSPHAIVLDVAQEAESIIFGLLLSLKGQVWMADVRLEPVGPDIPTTDLLAEVAPFFPTNLDFKE